MHRPQNNEETRFVEMDGAPHDCVYLPDQLARLSYVYANGPISGVQMDQQLAKGQRRSGTFLYWMNCPFCRACQPTRIPVDDFRWTTSLRRVLKKAENIIRTEFGDASVDDQHVELYNLHLSKRGLGAEGASAGVHEYREFLVDSCCNTKELRFYIADQLVGATVVDVGQDSISAVYTYFDPDFSQHSLGTFAILQLIEQAKRMEMRYLYLGLYVEKNIHLKYKARFAPQERLINGKWIRFDQPSSNWTQTVSNNTLHSEEQ